MNNENEIEIEECACGAAVEPDLQDVCLACWCAKDEKTLDLEYDRAFYEYQQMVEEDYWEVEQ